jgi:hypothetical protein
MTGKKLNKLLIPYYENDPAYALAIAEEFQKIINEARVGAWKATNL